MAKPKIPSAEEIQKLAEAFLTCHEEADDLYVKSGEQSKAYNVADRREDDARTAFWEAILPQFKCRYYEPEFSASFAREITTLRPRL